jgi:hypothetical protein
VIKQAKKCCKSNHKSGRTCFADNPQQLFNAHAAAQLAILPQFLNKLSEAIELLNIKNKIYSPSCGTLRLAWARNSS